MILSGFRKDCYMCLITGLAMAACLALGKLYFMRKLFLSYKHDAVIMEAFCHIQSGNVAHLYSTLFSEYWEHVFLHLVCCVPRRKGRQPLEFCN